MDVSICHFPLKRTISSAAPVFVFYSSRKKKYFKYYINVPRKKKELADLAFRG